MTRSILYRCPRCRQPLDDRLACPACNLNVPHVQLGPTFVADFLTPASSACPLHGLACRTDLDALQAPTPAQLAAPKPYHHKGKLLRALGPLRGQVVLDIGCREAPIAHVLAGDNTVSGVDLCPAGMLTGSPNALDKAYAALLLADAASLPLADAQADVVIAIDLLEHFLDPASLVDELVRVLAPGGRLLVSVPNLVSYNNRLSVLAGSGVGIELHQLLQGRSIRNPITGPRYPDQDQHVRWFTSRSLAALLGSRRLRVLRRLGYDPVLSRLPGMDRLLRNSCQAAAVLAVK